MKNSLVLLVVFFFFLLFNNASVAQPEAETLMPAAEGEVDLLNHRYPLICPDMRRLPFCFRDISAFIRHGRPIGQHCCGVIQDVHDHCLIKPRGFWFFWSYKHCIQPTPPPSPQNPIHRSPPRPVSPPPQPEPVSPPPQPEPVSPPPEPEPVSPPPQPEPVSHPPQPEPVSPPPQPEPVSPTPQPEPVTPPPQPEPVSPPPKPEPITPPPPPEPVTPPPESAPQWAVNGCEVTVRRLGSCVDNYTAYHISNEAIKGHCCDALFDVLNSCHPKDWPQEQWFITTTDHCINGGHH